MAKLNRRAYNAIYRARKAAADLHIKTSEQTIFYELGNHSYLEHPAVILLAREFSFAMQSELR